MESVNYRITEGSDYGWACYGHNAYTLDSWSGDNDTGYSASIVFDTSTQTVYEMDVCDYSASRAYRWIHPDFRLAHCAEARKYGSYHTQAWDDVHYIDLEVSKDMLQKTSAIVRGESYDTRVEVPFDVEDNIILSAALEAHKQDITLNQYIERILRSMIEQESKKL